MTNPNSSQPKNEEKASQPVTPLRCLTGSAIAGTFAIALYSLTHSIAETFAKKPVTSTNQLVINISAAVRTLVVGVASLATFIFAFVAIGLILLAIQLVIEKLKQGSISASDKET